MSENEERLARNQAIIDEFRSNGGRVAQFGDTPLLLLTTTGARSGSYRTSPVAYVADGERYLVIGANGGRPVDPAWCANLAAHPDASIEVDGRTLSVRARLATGDERERLWARSVATVELFGDLQPRTERVFPLYVLEPREP
jgi:deazaflavin-dependent oxidoreductase (nitroreductase family)